MIEHGVDIRSGKGMTRVHLSCDHQKGILYVVPAENSWVCSEEGLPAHAMAGFLGDLVDLGNSEVKKLMNRWGIKFRRLALDCNEKDAS